MHRSAKILLLLLCIIVAAAVWLLRTFRQQETPPQVSGDETESPALPLLSEEVTVEIPETAPVEVFEPTLTTDNRHPTTLPVSAAVETVVSKTASYAERVAALRKLGHDLSAADISALREFLESPVTDYSRLRPVALNSVKNDVLALLMEQDVMPQGLGGQIADMFSNPETDYMWREYCLQFMEPFCKRQSKVEKSQVKSPEDASGTMLSAPDALPDEQALIRETLFLALDERDRDLAATALLGLNRLSRQDDSIDTKRVLQKAVEIAGDSNASDSCRLTALRLAAENGCEDILPTARELVRNARTDLLKAAAIVSVGDFCREEDRELLADLSASSNRQVSSAAQMALKKFKLFPDPL